VAAGRRVVVTGGSGEESLTARVAGPSRSDVVDLGGQIDLATLTGVLAGAQVVVAPNTGPAHLAAAVGTPVVSLFAPTVPAVRWRPWGVPHLLLGDHDIACAGCRARTCPVPGHPCLETVPVHEVLAAVDAMDRRRPAWPERSGGPAWPERTGGPVWPERDDQLVAVGAP
jgi:ADP-heptose:LPS heptosyltransferase